jgi:hypothetical protein
LEVSSELLGVWLRSEMGVVGLHCGVQLAAFAALWWAMVGMVDSATFAEQFTAFSTDGIHVQVAPDGQEAKIVLDQYAGMQPHSPLSLQVGSDATCPIGAFQAPLQAIARAAAKSFRC